MTKLNTYEAALTLYGELFSALRNRGERYFLGSIKRELIFLFFALIWNKDNPSKTPSAKIGVRFPPRNFNEWKFGSRYIGFNEINPELWDLDQKYFNDDIVPKRTGKKSAVLSYGFDLKRAFQLQDLMKEINIGTVVDWKGNLKRDEGFAVIKKPWPSLKFWIGNTITVFKIYRFLKKKTAPGPSLFDFLGYLSYQTFVSARIRTILKTISKDKSIGSVVFSDVDNILGNSFSLWSRLFGFSQIIYPHGSPFDFNKHRFFKPDQYYIWTKFQENDARSKNPGVKTIPLVPERFKKNPQLDNKIREKIKNVIIATTMEENLEVPFGDKDKIVEYIREICDFLKGKGVSVYIKSHALLDWHEEYDKLAKEYDFLEHVKERWGLDKQKDMDLAIMLNPRTTLTMQLLYLGIPTIISLETTPEIAQKHFSVPNFPLSVKTKKELISLLDRFLSDKDFYRKAREEALATFKSTAII
ncbi:MAG: hypothetical protein HYW70_02985 [Candidatus Nealsonbacteria bacterium]|nr:hypothetical protein [Candidatus Nealsonbacteria bacterium]